MFAIEPGTGGAALQSLATELTRPRAVLVISPHWETKVPAVGTTEAVAGHRLEPIHDFSGFDQRLYEIQYPASGSPQGTQEVAQVLQADGLAVATDPRCGLDHGAWVPLHYLFPAADVPVVPLSIQHDGGASPTGSRSSWKRGTRKPSSTTASSIRMRCRLSPTTSTSCRCSPRWALLACMPMPGPCTGASVIT